MPAKRKIAANAQSEEKNNEAIKVTKQKKPKDKVDDDVALKKGKVEKKEKGKKAAGSKNEEIDDVEENIQDAGEESAPEVTEEPKGKQKKAAAEKDSAKKGKKTKNKIVDLENVRVTRNQSKKTTAAK